MSDKAGVGGGYGGRSIMDMYEALIWSRTDYGCVDLVVIQAHAVGFCLKTEDESIGVYGVYQVEEGEMPL